MVSVRTAGVPVDQHSAFRIRDDDYHDGVRSKPDRDNAQGISLFIFPLGAGSFDVGEGVRQACAASLHVGETDLHKGEPVSQA